MSIDQAQQSDIAIIRFQPNPRPRRQRSRKHACVYCGGVASTADHVVPEAIYTQSDLDSIQIQTVASCEECNGLKSQCDAPLRDYLVMDFDSSSHPKAIEIFNNEFMRAVGGNHVRALDHFHSGRNFPMFHRDGTFDKMGWEVQLPNMNVNESVNWITRGMHWVIFGERTNPKTVSSRIISRYERHDLLQRATLEGLLQGHFKQGEQYGCAYSDVPGRGVFWFHVFFDTVLFTSRSQRSVTNGT